MLGPSLRMVINWVYPHWTLNPSVIWVVTAQEAYSKICVKQPLIIHKTNILMANGSSIKVETIAECSPWSILQYFWPALCDNWSRKPNFGLFRVVILHGVYWLPRQKVPKKKNYSDHHYKYQWICIIFIIIYYRSLTCVTALCPWARHNNPCLVLVQPGKTRPDITDFFWLGPKETNQTNKQLFVIWRLQGSLSHKVSWVLGQVWNLIVSIPDRCLLLYFISWIYKCSFLMIGLPFF